MTTRNNFDVSSSGVNIECTAFYDTGKSRRDFEENFKILQHDGYRTSTKAYYIDNGNVEDDDAITFELQGTEDDIKAALKKDGYEDDDDTAKDALEIFETSYGEKITLLNYEDFNQVYAPLSVKPSKAIEKTTTRGYSQGDYAEVFYCPEDLEKCWGKKPDESELQKIFDHLFWDSPVYATVKINDDEFSYWDQPDYDEYEWDREKFLKWVAEKSSVPFEKLDDIMPVDPSWS